MTTVISHSITKKTLATLFASMARVLVLRVFVLDPRRTYYQRQIQAATELPIRAIQRELERLESIHLLYRHTEGNRAYYQIDVRYPLFPELREMILKAGDELDRLRANAALSAKVRLAFLDESGNRALIVVDEEGTPAVIETPENYEVEFSTTESFLDSLENDPESLTPYLKMGVDLLGRRDDLIWRNIETAGFNVSKGKGVP